MTEEKFYSLEALKQPVIKEFLALVEETVGEEILDFKHLQSAPFMKFWQYFMIYRHVENDVGNFQIMMLGSHIASSHDDDFTGKMMSDMGFAEMYFQVYEENMHVINTQSRASKSGALAWLGRDHKRYHLVRFPLQRNGDIKETLNIVVHE